MSKEKRIIEIKPVKTVKPRNRYDCSKCPGFCCTYPLIHVSTFDVSRLAKFHKLTVPEFRKKHLWYSRSEKSYMINVVKDKVFEKRCSFLDPKERRCTVYTARPYHCRAYPNGPKCGYYDFLSFERWHHADDEMIATTTPE
jgi:Fe-S-cluster containining protein